MVCQTRIVPTILTLMAAVLLFAGSARADLIQNGDFSDPDGAPWVQLVEDYPVGFLAPPGGDPGAFLAESDDYNYKRDGTAEANGGFSLTGIKQQFYLDQDATVAVSFPFTLTVTAPTETDYFDVLFDDSIVFSKSTSGLVPSPGPVGITFMGSALGSQFLEAGSHWLTLRLIGENDWVGPYPILSTVTVDDVTCAVVPLPGAALLGVLGLSCSGWCLQRRRTL